jgi:AAA+ superfamily predicted ATPase
MRSLAEYFYRPPAGLPSTLLLEITPEILLNRYQGGAEQALAEIFDKATRCAPCLILLDDADLLAKSRASTH